MKYVIEDGKEYLVSENLKVEVNTITLLTQREHATRGNGQSAQKLIIGNTRKRKFPILPRTNE